MSAHKGPTARQLAFASLIVQGKSQSDAYRAIYAPNATDRTAAENGSKMGRKPTVKAEIERLKARSERKTILSLNDRLGILARDAQTTGERPADINARARVIEVYSKISGDQAPERVEHSGKDGAPIQQEVAVSGVVQVLRLSVRDKMRLLREARERDKASHDRA